MKVEVETKLNIGDFVVRKSSMKELELGTTVPRLLYVEEVKIAQCTGGTQTYYHLRTQNGSIVEMPEDAILLVDADLLKLVHDELLRHRKERQEEEK